MATAISAVRVALPPRERKTSPQVRARVAEAPPHQIAGWRIDDELGHGGMATVYAVTHCRSGNHAALKLAHRDVLRDTFTADTFLREARVVRAIAHPGVPDVYATGSFGELPYLLIERISGTTLGRMVDRAPVPRVRALEILVELCDILRAAHRAGVVHRDLKLDNVIVCDAPFADSRRVKLIDWGVARVAGEDDPFRGLIAGTLVYVAPEQVRGDPITPAADVYALAVLAYHLLCRRPPFQSSSELALISMHLRTEPPRASLAWPDIPPELDTLLWQMLAKQADERPSLDDVEAGLRRALSELAPPPPLLVAHSVDTAPRTLPTGSDPFGRIELPVPPLRASWIALAIGLAGLAALLHQLPL
jgi:serine/threonine-protein kinase